MSFQNDKDNEPRRKPDPDPRNKAEDIENSPPPPKRRRGNAGEVGDALRSVYQRAIDEDIPPEMLDLLGKLG